MVISHLKNKLTSWLLKHAQGNDLTENLAKDARQYERFSLCSLQAAQVQTASQKILPVVNLSYGGFSTLVEADQETVTTIYEDATLSFLGKSIDTRINRVYRHSHTVGYRFEHRDAKTLIFLREILEHLRFGSSLHEIRKEFLKDDFQGREWICLRGEGPTDITMKVDEEGHAASFLCTFRNGEFYYELRLKDGHYSTGRSIDQAGTGARIAPTVDLDLDTLRLVMQILLGIRNEKIIAAIKPTINFGLKTLGIIA